MAKKNSILKTEVSRLLFRKKVRCFNILHCFILKPKYLTKEQTQDNIPPNYTNHSFCSPSVRSVCLCLQLSLSNLFLCKCILFQQPTGVSPTPPCPQTHCSRTAQYLEKNCCCIALRNNREQITGQIL